MKSPKRSPLKINIPSSPKKSSSSIKRSLSNQKIKSNSPNSKKLQKPTGEEMTGNREKLS